jgi:glycosyltransferase involved in cell wall biosynthesis
LASIFAIIFVTALFYVTNVLSRNLRNSDVTWDGTPKVSIIVPVYNSEKYLRDCLDSAVSQTLREIEIICVNDGSEDSSGEILGEYAAKDDRILALNEENQGVSAARNYGIKESHGEYIEFLDSDDFLHPETCEVTYNAAKVKNADIVIFGADTFNSEKGYENFISPIEHTSKDSLKSFFDDTGCRGYCFNKIYRKQLFTENNINFHEDIRWGEDLLLQHEIIPRAKALAFLPDHFYKYRRDNQLSITWGRYKWFDFKKFLAKAFDYVIKSWRQIDVPEKYRAELFYEIAEEFEDKIDVFDDNQRQESAKDFEEILNNDYFDKLKYSDISSSCRKILQEISKLAGKELKIAQND